MKLATLLYCVLICLTLIVWKFLSQPSEYMTDWANSQLAFYHGSTSSWSVTTGKYADICREPPPISNRKQHGYFLHITDMHVDLDYKDGATVKSACHFVPSTSILKKNKQTSVLAGKYGAPGERCDAPINLAKETLDWISKEWKDKLDFVIWTGDNAKHNWDKKNHKRKRRDVYELNQRVTELMMETFWTNDKIPVIPSFGNNDVYPHNQIGGSDVDGDLLYFFERLWRPLIPIRQRTTFKEGGGYYIVKVAPRLNVITLNSMYFYYKNKAVNNCVHIDSPASGQLRWFESQLEKARQLNEKVYVIGHIPPSPRDYKNTCLEEYKRVAAIYSDVIQGHFFAHLNMDHFLLFDGRDNIKSSSPFSQQKPLEEMDDDDKPRIEDEDEGEHDIHTTRNVMRYMDWLKSMYQALEPLDGEIATPHEGHPPLFVIQIAPSVIPVYSPSFRIYRYALQSSDSLSKNTSQNRTHKKDEGIISRPYGTLLGFSQYYANLTKWNNPDMAEEENLQYELEYDTKEAYNMEDLTVTSYYELAKLMVDGSEKGDKLWSKFCDHMLVKSQTVTT
ncbi:Metallo-dependent phosphatase-like protein [Mycotypha africana]|uniref:Metallo-dependent phosphatase-like protein n=1 Tax=Mycotypha africana TaxID=64632 RepID=UPI002300259B|nr:Metallo-dependent phosphatase-like protein [Mycotypha africana]KAI8975532.1 Metallo-dependent phosphatase-like protein [Mycotypha africana]